jgi:trehalose 6-phosphate phosphatase
MTAAGGPSTAELAARADQVALCLDFDGTLSPIVPDPEAARPLEGMVELLGPLAARFAAVALISGRPAVIAAGRDLREHPAVRDSGAWLEDKRYAVAVHTRRVADSGRWAKPIDQTAREVADRHGLEVVPGKLVWELRPAVPSDKGDAVRRVVAESGARSVAVAGDDLGDLPAFTTAAQLAAEGGEALRIAVRSAEAPPALLAAADLVVDGPAGLRELLQQLR